MTSQTVVKGDTVVVWCHLEDHTRLPQCDVKRGGSLDTFRGRRVRIGVGRAAMNRAEIMRSHRGVAIEMLRRECADAPPQNGLISKHVYAQNLSSAVVGHVLGPQPGEVVVDMCAAPGGKTTHLASLMQNTGTLVCIDASKRKAVALHELKASLGFSCMVPLFLDSGSAVLRPDDDTFGMGVTDIIEHSPTYKPKASVSQ